MNTAIPPILVGMATRYFWSVTAISEGYSTRSQAIFFNTMDALVSYIAYRKFREINKQHSFEPLASIVAARFFSIMTVSAATHMLFGDFHPLMPIVTNVYALIASFLMSVALAKDKSEVHLV